MSVVISRVMVSWDSATDPAPPPQWAGAAASAAFAEATPLPPLPGQPDPAPEPAPELPPSTPAGPPVGSLVDRLNLLIFACDYRGPQLGGLSGGCGCNPTWHCAMQKGASPTRPFEVHKGQCVRCVLGQDG